MLRRAVSVLLLARCALADIPSDVNPYLRDTKYLGTPSVVFLDDIKTKQLNQQYSDLARAYDAKRTYGTATQADVAAYNVSMTALGQGVVEEIKRQQLETNSNKLVKALRSDPNIAAVEEAGKYPAVVIGTTLALYRGTTYTIKHGDVAFTPGTSLRDRSASLAVVTPVLNTSVSASPQNVTTSLSRGIVEHVDVSFTNTALAPTPASNTLSFNYRISL